MTVIIFKGFQLLFRLVTLLIIAGTITTALIDIQKRAFESKRSGLASMLHINQQLVGKTK